jgi:aldehyde:ferredoxin oxidoreductase
MTTQRIRREAVPADLAGLGGRALTSGFICAEVPPECDPLGPDNKLIFAPGLLSGTRLVNTSRLSIGAKSPLTGGIKESNVGGTVAAVLGRMGIAGIIVEGQAAAGERFILKIDEAGELSLMPAQAYQGLGTYALVEKLLEAHGEKNSVLCIGPAGERQLKSASIQATDVEGRPCRAAGRGGLGAVMGAKGIKAIVVDPRAKAKVPLADPEGFKAAAKDFAKVVKEIPFSGKTLPALGTAGLLGPVNGIGAFPCYNATQGVFDGQEKINADALVKTIQARGGKTGHMGCSQCMIRCSNEFVDEAGAFVTSSLEYETIWATGGMCGIDDLDVIARLDRLCDDTGVDTMNTGVAVAVAMDAGHCQFGDARAAIDLVEQISQGTEMGRLIGDGPAAVGRHFGHHRVPVCKNQSIAAYDPRAIQGMAVTYSTSPMGADHTAGNLIGDALGGALDPLSAEGQVEASRERQTAVVVLDSLGLCLFTLAAARASWETVARLINARLGTDFTTDEVPGRWIDVIQAERAFNRKAGLTNEDDRLARFFYDEPLPPHNKAVMISDPDMDSTFASLPAA